MSAIKPSGYEKKFCSSPGEKNSFRCELLSFGEVYRLSKLLADKIKVSGYKPDLLIAIGRGGYVPARLVSDFLIFKDLTSMKIEHYGMGADIEEKAIIRFPLPVDIRGKKVLIVDDVTDTGQTLELAVGYIRSLGPSEIRTAVMQHKRGSAFVPDYHAQKIIKWRWIVYPWAVYEDLMGFTLRVLEAGAAGKGKGLDLSGILAGFRDRHGVEVKEKQILEILEELSERGKIERLEGPAWKIRT
ncbi:MAG: phosphoribosyltransferase [Methanosarcinaceae archaeon]|nr:phosphoribosyltransferase [Methanosarcinaceae archaeon]